jgi:hypothetical protein
MPEGVSSLLRRIEDGVGVSPLGLGKPEHYGLLYKHTASHVFGQSTSLRCPHYVDRDGGLCGIWASRNSVCSTWFCKHERGASGQAFWRDIKELLREVESELALWCVRHMNFEADALRSMLRYGFSGSEAALANEIRDGQSNRSAAETWGRWHKREAEFYRSCWHMVRSMEWEAILEICGPRVQLLARTAKAAYDGLTSSSIPTNLVLRSVTAGLDGDPQSVRIVSYSKYDPISVQRDVWLALTHFDGRPQQEVRADIERDEGIRLAEDLVAALVDYEILGTSLISSVSDDRGPNKADTRVMRRRGDVGAQVDDAGNVVRPAVNQLPAAPNEHG